MAGSLTSFPGNRLVGWAVTDGKKEDEAQCVGLLEELGATVEKFVVPKAGISAKLAPWLPPVKEAHPKYENGFFPRPLADIIVGSGRRAAPYINAFSRLSVPRPVTVFLKSPHNPLFKADLIWIPEHDRLSGRNVISSLTAPHRYSSRMLKRITLNTRSDIHRLRHPRLAVILGENSRRVSYNSGEIKRFLQELWPYMAEATSVMLCSSQYTPPILLEAVRAMLPSQYFINPANEKDNAYPEILANADCFFITGDSHNLISEVVATGKPVHAYRPHGLAAKVHYFLDELTAKNAVFPTSTPLQTKPYPAINATGMIADEVRIELRIRKE